MDPTHVSMGSQFPNADLVEKWTDGKFIFTQNISESSKLVGFFNSNDNIIIDYAQAMLFAKRPISFGDSITESYTDEYSANGYDFKGGGTIQLKGDGYGTLILPHRTYQNALRVKMSQIQIDTIVQFGVVSTFSSVTYLWYDGENPSALLKINFIYADVLSKDVSYLTSSLVGVNDISKTSNFSVYPNPCSDWLTVKPEQSGEISIYNQLGVEVYQNKTYASGQLIDLDSLPKGLYFLKFRNELNQISVERIVIN
jgi:hypothetical protein